MDGYLKQATASQSRTIGPFISDTDFKTVQTGLTIANTDIKLMANGAASASKNSGGGTHRQSGIYGVTFDATDTATVGELKVSSAVSGALLVFHTFIVLEEAVYDMLFGASAVGYITDQPVNTTKVGGTSQTARDLGASVLLSTGTGTGQLDFTSGVVKSNLAQILGTALTETAGQLAAAFKKFFNIATPASTMDALTLVATATNLTNAPTSGDLTAAMKTSVTTAATAATPTAAAVTGSVGSVATGGITSGSFAAGAIDATAIAADAIGASELAAGAASEIATAVRTELTTELGRVDVAVSTRGTGAALDAAGVRSAIGLASANLDTQLDALPTAAENATAAWAAGTRVLTAGTNIVLAKDTGVTGFNDPSAAAIRAEMDSNSTDLDAIGALATAIKAKTDNLPSDPADQSLIIAATDAIMTRLGAPVGASLSVDIATLDTVADGIATAISDKTGYRLSSAGVNDILRTALTEGYAAEGATMTLEQAVYMIVAILFNRSVTGTTLTAKKLDGSTDAMSFTLDDADTPTSQVRAT